MWLGLNSQYFNQTEAKLNLDPTIFIQANLKSVLRNPKLIMQLTNDIRNYLLSNWRITRFTFTWANYPQELLNRFEQAKASGEEMFKNIDYKLPTSGHCVDGLLPKLVILEIDQPLLYHNSPRN